MHSYEEYFHPFFPIIPRETFDRTRLPWLSRAEPHLFSAILTIASKDNEPIHQVCYEHMQQLVSNILAGGEADVEAVEALLLLSQWVSHRPQQQIAVGRGEEDRVAWMYIGTALRLGYFLGIDRTSFKSSTDSSEPVARFNRKRLVWAACYTCDRQVSVRLGKGFWSRGPGPLSGLKSSDFPALQPVLPNEDNWALIFQANLELTQIFSNVHDILYASKGHGWKEMLEGRYAKYLDDFRTSIRSWNDIWGTLICSPRLKASLLLTFDYLRLYVNAFAYQATISRALIYQRDSQHNPNQPMPLINSTAPDARFIYEALDAAKSLLSTFNNFVDPQTLRYMPSSYYLFIIYSAVFLYKARSTTTMTEEERTGVRRMINQTIDRLQKASVGPNHMGSRYSRLIQMLWRKPPKANQDATRHQSIDGRLKAPENELPTTILNVYNPNTAFDMGMTNMATTNVPNGTFSWLDLGATWNFATQNNNTSVSGGSTGEMDDMMGVDTGMSPFDMSLLTDYRLLDGDNPNFIF
ncbi:C6 transcription factor [Phlyctema vagabunda]|uniref:C6 transcription factor n=1 Tax=Phlyctema vagabunda TaxID=108571 RepID=A0ABR4PB88_9HELO